MQFNFELRAMACETRWRAISTSSFFNREPTSTLTSRRFNNVRKKTTLYKMDGSTLLKENMEFRRNLALMRQSGTFCDAMIRIPGESKQLPVHRAIMSSCSDFFRSLFTNGLQETLQDEVVIHGISLKMMETIIEYAYTKEVTITSDNAEDIFIAADRFHVLGLLQDCIDFFAAEMSPENCIGLLRFARHFSNKELIDLCWVYILSHFKPIITQSHEFINLHTDELLEIITDDRLAVDTEDVVFDAVMKWVDFEQRERREDCQKLLNAVRFPFMSEDALHNTVIGRRDLKRGQCWKRIEACYDLFIRYRATGNQHMKSRTKELAKLIKPRIPSHVIFVIGGWARDGVTESVETYDRNTDQWFASQEFELPQPRAYHGTVTIRDQVFVVGGFNGSHYLNSVVCFDVSKKMWEEKAPMYMSRCYVSTVGIDGTIYACGGYDGRQRHNSAEKYDRNRNQWSLIKSMHYQRSDAGATSIEGKIYVAGGFDGTSCLLSAEVYDPLTDQWTLLASMSVRRSGVSLVTCDATVFAIGGYDGQRRLDSVEYFDSIRRQWVPSTPMLLGRSNFSSVVMDGVIYAMGGYDGDKTSQEVECYHPRSKSWQALSDMHVGRSAVSACAVTDIYNARDFSFHGNESMSMTSNMKLMEITSVEQNKKYACLLNKWSE